MSGVDVREAVDGKPNRWDWVFRALNRPLGRRLVSEPAYYWLLDRLADNNGWRPLFYGEPGR